MAVKKILIRAFKLFAVHFLLVITCGLVQFIVINDFFPLKNVFHFIIDSFLFNNQIGLLHILPTFIFLYLYSIIILRIISLGFMSIVFSISLLLVFLGLNNPMIFNYGDPSVFPLVLWQVFFVLGIFLGKNDIIYSQLVNFSNSFLLFLFICLFISLIIRHVNFEYVFFGEAVYSLKYSKFPLNLGGIFFGLSIWLFIGLILVRFWHYISKFKSIWLISTLGDNALLAFFVHIFLAKTIEIICFLSGNKFFISYTIVGINFLIFLFIIPNLNQQLLKNQSTTFAKIFIWLFK